jgi:hypothetical protein
MTRYISTFKYLLISARNIPTVVCVAPPEDEQVMVETCKRYKGKGKAIPLQTYGAQRVLGC